MRTVLRFSSQFTKGLFVVALVMAAVFVAPPASAVQPETMAQTQEVTQDIQITATPTSARHSLEPGRTYSGTMTLLNTGKKAFDFTMSALPYQVTGNDYNPIFSKETPRTQISRWISFPEGDKFRLEFNQQIKVPYTITVPSDIPDGGQYAVIFAETQPEESQLSGSGVISKQRVGMVVYGQAAGKTRESGTVENVIVDKWQQNAPLTVKWQVKNDGNTDFMSKTSMRVLSLGGKEVYKTEPKELPVLPETTRDITATWDDAPIGIYKVEASATVLGHDTTKTLYVVVAPLYLVVLAVIGLGVLLFVIVMIIRKQLKRRRG